MLHIGTPTTREMLPTRAARVALLSVHGGPLAETGAEEAGGQNVYVREVARALARLGLEVDVFTRGRDHGEIELLSIENARVIRLPAGPRGFIGRDQLYSYLPEFLQRFTEYSMSTRRRYDVVHSNYWLSGWVGARYCSAFKIPQVHTHHSLGAVKFASTGVPTAMGQTRLSVEQALIRSCHAVIATSPQDVLNMETYYQTAGTSVVVPCAIDPRIFYPRIARECRARLGLPQSGPLLAYVGRFTPEKGIDTFLRAAAQIVTHRGINLVFAGGFDPAARDVAEFARIQTLATELGLGERCHFLGKVSHDRLPFVYGAADLCVVPSHYESFGMVAIESMACGTPVVASDVGGLPFTVVHGSTGLLAECRSAEAFSQAVEALLEDDSLRAAMGRNATRLVHQKFTWPLVGARLAELYSALIAHNRVRSVGRG